MSGAAPAPVPSRCPGAASLFAAAVAVLSVGAASAQDRPLLLPERDVAVVYRVVGGPPSVQEMRMAWLAGEGRQRIEMPGARATVVDHKDLGASFIVSDEHRVVIPLHGRLGASMGLPGGASAAGRFTRTGAANYAGLPCAVWRYEDKRQTGEACITADGVMLRGVGTQDGRTGGVEAVRVNYGPQDPARFRRPENYRVVQPPAPGTPGR